MTQRQTDRQSETATSEMPTEQRWKRLVFAADKPGTPGFTFDNSVLPQPEKVGVAEQAFQLESLPHPSPGLAKPPAPLRGTVSEGRSPKPGVHALKMADPLPADPDSSRVLRYSFGFALLALVLIGLLFLVLQSENIGSDPFAQWRSAPAPRQVPSTGESAVTAEPPVVAKPRPRPRQIATSPAPAPEPEPVPARVPVAPTPRDRSDNDAEALFSLAAEHLKHGDAAGAEEVYQRLVREGQQPGRAALALGDIYLARESFDEAQKMFQLAHQFFAETPRPAPSRQ